MADKQLINDLLEIGAVQVKVKDFFTWTSGLKSPIYCDNRLTMSFPEIRNRIASQFAEKMNTLPYPVEVVAGCATAGIPHAAWVADLLNLPMVYVRSSAKKHGKGNQIEGVVKEGMRAIVIEDLISTGKSSIDAALALRNAGVEVNEVFSIFTYNFTAAEEAFRNEGLTYTSLATFDELLESMIVEGKINDQELERLHNWKTNPEIFTQAE
ncbi:orotate phosphoribosyltransferase [Halobacillus salinarum]|uniref:Orotate phosphoribosyltransferase n=1 Tax=Halobacillus salinarum TaxID=2932257 RepID=A0ABY4EHJ9_9BACI|nr:orotate phosphoribosyltransferase [Halobacillus salinarum]UOQ43109.1 orotate phosphoribosyltransferase [Halobacillus salinarum]